jgi:trehalose 6-phosphate synthase/phosphatase
MILSKYLSFNIKLYFSDDLANQDYWNAYKQVNVMISNTIMKHIEGPKDLIWVNDLHFLLVPFFLREKDKALYIGLFLHSSFPNS